MQELLTSAECTLPTEQRPLRLAEFDAVFAEAVWSVDRVGDVVRLRMAGRAGLRARVQDLADRETSCCSFFSFDVSGSDNELVVTVRAAGHDSILDALASRARELAPV